MKFCYVYVLKSKIKNFLYVGFTHNVRKRFIEHNNGEELSTRAYAPFELIYYEAYLLKSDAKAREKYLKTSMGKRVLKKQLANFLKKIKKRKSD